MIAKQPKPSLIEGHRYRVYFQIPSDRTNSGIGLGEFIDTFRGMRVLNGHEFYCFNEQPPLDERFLDTAQEVA